MFENLIGYIKNLVLNKSFLIGFVICLAFFSKYIFGDDNLLEELGEKFTKETTGIDIDFSPNDSDPDRK